MIKYFRGNYLKVYIVLLMVFSLTNNATFAYEVIGCDNVENATISSESEIKINNLIFEISDIEKGDFDRYAPKGKKYLKIHLNVINKGDKQVGITANTMFSLSDINNNIYKTMPEPKNSLNGLIEPNDNLMGDIYFLVPCEENEFILTIKPNMNEDDYAKVNIKNDKWSLETINTTKENSDSNNETKASFSKKEHIVSNISFAINRVYTKTSDPYRIPSNGNDILYFDITIKNLNKVQYGMTSIMVFKLKDKSGNTYNIITPEGNNSLNGLINYNQSLNGIVRFEVPTDESKFTLCIKPFMMYNDSIEINVSR